MLLSDLLAADVRRPNGESMGRVEEVIFVQDPDVAERGAPPLRLTDIVVSKPGRGRIHAFVHPDVHGPRAVKAIASWFLRHSVLVPWSDVDTVSNGVVTVKPGTRPKSFHGLEEAKTKSSAERKQ